MKTSIRLALTALAVSGVTFAASGKPLSFLDPADEPVVSRSAPLPPASPDSDAPAIVSRNAGPALSNFQ